MLVELSSLKHLTNLTLINCDMYNLNITNKLTNLHIEYHYDLALNINNQIENLSLSNISPQSQIFYHNLVKHAKYSYTVYSSSLFLGTQVDKIDNINFNQVEFIEVITDYRLNPISLIISNYYISNFLDYDADKIFNPRLHNLSLKCLEPKTIIPFTAIQLRKLSVIKIKGHDLNYINMTSSEIETIKRQNIKNKLEI